MLRKDEKVNVRGKNAGGLGVGCGVGEVKEGVAGKGGIEGKIEKLRGEVEWFYADEFRLDEALERYKGAAGLAREIEGDLEKLENEIKIVGEDFTKA
jgi:exonuclease VII small subunit